MLVAGTSYRRIWTKFVDKILVCDKIIRLYFIIMNFTTEISLGLAIPFGFQYGIGDPSKWKFPDHATQLFISTMKAGAVLAVNEVNQSPDILPNVKVNLVEIDTWPHNDPKSFTATHIGVNLNATYSAIQTYPNLVGAIGEWDSSTM
jgi:hypothetical protein